MKFYIATFLNSLNQELYKSHVFNAVDFEDAVDYVRTLELECVTAKKFELAEVNDMNHTILPIDVIINL